MLCVADPLPSALRRPLICVSELVVEATSTRANTESSCHLKAHTQKTPSESSGQPGRAGLPTQRFLSHEFVAISSCALLWMVGNFLFSSSSILAGQQAFNCLSVTHYLHVLPRYGCITCAHVCVLLTGWPNFFTEWFTVFCNLIPPPLSANRAYLRHADAIASSKHSVMRKEEFQKHCDRIMSLRDWSNVLEQCNCTGLVSLWFLMLILIC